MLDNLKDYNIVLGSSSPRRQELLKRLHVDFSTIKPKFEEEILPIIPIRKVSLYLAKQKASYLADQLKENDLLITADTIVILGDKILGKPISKAQAIEMLEALSTKKHEVITGVSVFYNGIEKNIEDTTQVCFDALSKEEINFYVDQYQPFDKAGAYGIQEWISLVGIKRIKGSYYNVMGLPIQKLYQVLKGIR